MNYSCIENSNYKKERGINVPLFQENKSEQDVFQYDRTGRTLTVFRKLDRNLELALACTPPAENL